MAALIEARQIKKSFWVGEAETSVLKGVDLVVEAEARLVIVGASGCGKSTLLHVISSLEPPTTGEVLFRGESVYQYRDQELSRLRNQHIGFVFQFHHLISELTALENVTVPLMIRGISRRTAREKAEALLGEVGLLERMEHRPSELSGGEQQRVAIARAMITEPQILFADEPTGNLDQENGAKILQLLVALHAKRKTALVVVTHNETIIRAFPRCFRLEDGVLKIQGEIPLSP